MKTYAFRFATRYPAAKISVAQKQTKPDGKIAYELAFKDEGKRRAFIGENTYQ